MEVAAVHAIGDQLCLLLAQLDEPLPVLIVKVDDGGSRRLRARSLEENRLGREIIFHRAVIVEMIASQIGEHGYIEWNSKGPLLLQRVRRNLHHRFRTTGCNRAREELVQLQRFGRRVRSGIALFLDAILHRAHQRGLASPSRSIAFNRKLVVVLPLVPVIPLMKSRSAGRP